MPRPATCSGRTGSKVVVESLRDGTDVREDIVVQDRHLNDISENIGRSIAVL